MSDDTIPDMMNTLRGLKHDLEKVLADAVAKYEEATGLHVEDVELIRTMNVDARGGSRVASIQLTVRL